MHSNNILKGDEKVVTIIFMIAVCQNVIYNNSYNHKP